MLERIQLVACPNISKYTSLVCHDLPMVEHEITRRRASQCLPTRIVHASIVSALQIVSMDYEVSIYYTNRLRLCNE